MRVGDVIEIVTGAGLAYAQYTHRHAMYGELVRVLPGLHRQRPDVHALAGEEARFVTFYPLTAILRDPADDVRLVSNEPVPEAARAFPLFRDTVEDPDTGELQHWLWDGERATRLESLDAEHRRLSPVGIVNHELLVHRIVSGWRPEDWLTEPRAPQRKAPLPSEAESDVARPSVRFFLYFPTKDAAERARQELVRERYAASVQRGDDWGVQAKRGMAVDEIDEAEQVMSRLAQDHGGVYDGHEIAVRH